MKFVGNKKNRMTPTFPFKNDHTPLPPHQPVSPPHPSGCKHHENIVPPLFLWRCFLFVTAPGWAKPLRISSISLWMLIHPSDTSSWTSPKNSNSWQSWTSSRVRVGWWEEGGRKGKAEEGDGVRKEGSKEEDRKTGVFDELISLMLSNEAEVPWSISAC